MIQKQRHLNTDEAAAFLGVSTEYLRELTRQGTIPAERLGQRGRLRFRARDLRQALQPARAASD